MVSLLICVCSCARAPRSPVKVRLIYHADIFSNAATFEKAGRRQTSPHIMVKKNVLMTQRAWVEGRKHQRNARFLNANVFSGVTGLQGRPRRRVPRCSGAPVQRCRCRVVPHAAVLPGGSGLERAGRGASREDRCAAGVHMAAPVCRSHVPTSVFLLYLQIQPLLHRLLPRSSLSSIMYHAI